MNIMEVETAIKAISNASMQIELAVDEGLTQTEEVRQSLAAFERRFVNLRERASGSTFRRLGLDRRKMREALKVSPVGLNWLIEHGKIPPPDCKVPSWEWRGAGKYIANIVDDGWAPESADKIQAISDELRQVYADRHKKRKA